MLLRSHHCLADGVSTATIMGRLTDQADAIDEAVAEEIAKRRRARGKRPSLLARLLKRLAFALRVLAAALATALAMLTAPGAPRKRRPGARTVARRAETDRSVGPDPNS